MPGCVAMGSLGEHAVSNATGATNRRAVTVFSWLTGLTMAENSIPSPERSRPVAARRFPEFAVATGASSTLPTASAAACSPSVVPKYTVVAVTSGAVRLPVSVTFQPASRSRSPMRLAPPSSPPMLKTRTSALAAGAADVLAVVEVTVRVAVESSVLSLLPEPMAWKPTSRKMTPRNSSTMTMARSGRPEESGTRSFIAPTVAVAGCSSRKRSSPGWSTRKIRGPRSRAGGRRAPSAGLPAAGAAA